METFRRLMRGWLGKILMVAFLAPFAFTGFESYFSARQQFAAKVNGEVISQQNYDQAINQRRTAYLELAQGDNSALNNQLIQKQVLDDLIAQELLLQQAKKLGLNLSDEYLSQRIRQIPAFLENGQFSQAKFEQILQHQNLSVDRLLASQREQEILTLMNDGILKNTPYSAQSMQALINMLAQERISHIAQIDLNQFAQNFKASDADAKTYFEKNKHQFTLPARIDVSYIVASPKAMVENVQVTDTDIQAQYQDYVAKNSKDAKREVSHILITTEQRDDVKAKALMTEIQQKLKAGESFEALAKQYSDDTASKNDGGKVVAYNVGVFGNEFDRAVVALSKGKISAPIKTQYGYHLIRLDDVQGVGNLKSFDEMKAQLVNAAKIAKVQTQFLDLVNKANDEAIQADSLQPIAIAFKQNIQTVQGFSQKTPNPVLAQAAVRSKLFSPEIAQGDRNVSSAITLPNQDVAWFKVNQYYAEKTPTFEEVKAQVLQSMKRDEQIKQAKASITDSLNNFANETAASALQKTSLKFQNIGAVPRNGQKVSKAIERAIFSVVPPKAEHWSVTTTDVGDKLYVIGVSAVQKNPQFDQSTPDILQQIQQTWDNRANVIFQNYVRYLRGQAKIKISEN